MNNALLFMCLMGSLMYVFYLLLCRLFEQRFTPKLRLLALVVAGCFYLIPFPLFYRSYIDRAKTFLNEWFHLDIPERYESQVVFLPASKTISVNGEGEIVSLPDYSGLFWVLAGIWLLVMVVALVISWRRYHRERRLLFSASEPTSYRCTYKTLFRREKSVQVRMLPAKQTPFVMGYFKPVIFIPEGQERCAEAILAHETGHIRYRDNFVKLMGFLVFVVHWYCPLAFFYFLSLGNTLELLCDRRVLWDSTQAERDAYVDLLLGMPVDEAQKVPYLVHFSSFGGVDYHFMKERLLMIKHNHMKKSLGAVILLVVFAVTAAVPVMAYMPPYMWKVAYTVEDEGEFAGDFWFIPEGATLPEELNWLLELDYDTEYLAYGDHYILSDDGVVYYVDVDSQKETASCVHIHKDGEEVKHEKKSDGSCTVYVYKVDFCTECLSVFSQTRQSESVEIECPH